MFWVTFFVSGLTIASIPWVSSHFGNRIAGYLVLVPIMMTLSLIVQYLSHGPKAATELLKGALLGLPSLLVFGLVAIILLKNHFNLSAIVLVSLIAWFVSILAINFVTGK